MLYQEHTNLTPTRSRLVKMFPVDENTAEGTTTLDSGHRVHIHYFTDINTRIIFTLPLIAATKECRQNFWSRCLGRLDASGDDRWFNLTICPFEGEVNYCLTLTDASLDTFEDALLDFEKFMEDHGEELFGLVNRKSDIYDKANLEFLAEIDEADIDSILSDTDGDDPWL